MDKAVYIYRNAWKNANDNLDIRGNQGGANTISGAAPNNKNVPKVFAYTPKGWDQIYPAKEVPSGRIKYKARKLNHYRYHSLSNSQCAGPSKQGRTANGQARVKRGVLEWGWKNNGVSAQGFYEEDYNIAGNKDYSYVHMEHAGWIDLGSNALRALPNHASVKDITYLKFYINRRINTGWTSKPMNFDLCLNGLDECGYMGGKANNPFKHKVGDYSTVCTIPGGTGVKEVVINLDSAQGQACANLFRKWMRGEATSIFMMNNEKCHDKHHHDGWATWVACSRNYTKVNDFSFEIEYTTE